MFVVDNNLSPKIARFLAMSFPGSRHVADADLEDADDREVWMYAKANGLNILTKDRDFIALLQLRGFPPKVVRLNCGNVTTKQVIALLQNNLAELRELLASSKHGLLILQ